MKAYYEVEREGFDMYYPVFSLLQEIDFTPSKILCGLKPFDQLTMTQSIFDFTENNLQDSLKKVLAIPKDADYDYSSKSLEPCPYDLIDSLLFCERIDDSNIKVSVFYRFIETTISFNINVPKAIKLSRDGKVHPKNFGLPGAFSGVIEKTDTLCKKAQEILPSLIEYNRQQILPLVI